MRALVCAGLFTGPGTLWAAEPPKALAGPPVELPPMLVEESKTSTPWYYVQAGGTEYLSRCSAATTREFIEAVVAQQQLMRVLVPEEFLARSDVPAVCVLYGQDLEHKVSAEIQRELQGIGQKKNESPDEHRVNIAPNMRLTDRDMHATIVYIDEALFDGSTLSLAPGHVRYLMQRRVPELPAWLIDGVERAWRRADFVVEPVTLGPMIWINSSESEALAGDPGRPRAILPANELFASDVARAAETRHARRVEVRSATEELFFRWAIASGPVMREALWTFVARAVEGPVTEEMFEACFGFDFAELRDRLSDYVPDAVDETKTLDPGKLAARLKIDVERATPNQIARVRGEWERLAIGHVQRRLPQVREPYLVQARRTLRRAYDDGDRDPRLLATMGLCEIDAGNDVGALEFLEQAAVGGVVRPRAYYELARLRFAALRRDAAETKAFSYAELAPVLHALQQGAAQSPALPEIFSLLGEAWVRCESGPNTAEFAELRRGARLFARRPAVALPIAQALVRHDKKGEASAVLDGCATGVIDDAARASIARLRAEISGVGGDAATAR